MEQRRRIALVLVFVLLSVSRSSPSYSPSARRSASISLSGSWKYGCTKSAHSMGTTPSWTWAYSYPGRQDRRSTTSDWPSRIRTDRCIGRSRSGRYPGSPTRRELSASTGSRPLSVSKPDRSKRETTMPNTGSRAYSKRTVNTNSLSKNTRSVEGGCNPTHVRE